MVQTRTQSSVKMTTDETIICHLRETISALEKENSFLLRQVQSVCAENDRLRKNTPMKKVLKTKDMDTRFYKPSDQKDTERCIFNYILEGLIPDILPRPQPLLITDDKKTHVKTVEAQIEFQHDNASKLATDPNLEVGNGWTTVTKRSRKAEKNKKEPTITVIGTSLVQDVLLNSAGARGCTYCYPGEYVPYITSRAKYILKGEQPDYCVLQCAGNDLERYPNHIIIQKYENLIQEVRKQAPTSTIILGTVPPRGKNTQLLHKIKMFNTYLINRGKYNDNVISASLGSSRWEYYRPDGIHFNENGATLYTKNLINTVINLHPFQRYMSKQMS